MQAKKVKLKERLAGVLKRLKEEPNNYKLHTLAGELFIKFGFEEEGIQEFNISMALEPAYEKNYHYLAQVYERLQKYDKSLKYLKKLLVYAKRPEEIYLKLGKLYYKLKDYKEALNSLEKARKMGIKDMELYIWLDKVKQQL